MMENDLHNYVEITVDQPTMDTPLTKTILQLCNDSEKNLGKMTLQFFAERDILSLWRGKMVK